MASYMAGFDPPTRPSYPTRLMANGHCTPNSAGPSAEMLGAFTGSTSERIVKRDDLQTRNPQLGLLRPGMRDPSPVPRSFSEINPEKVKVSKSGFGRETSKVTASAPAAAGLGGKSSRNVLRRKASAISPSVISQHPGSRRPTPDHGAVSPPRRVQNSANSHQSQESLLKSAEAYKEIFTRDPAVSKPPQIIPELDRYRVVPTPNTGKFASGIPHKLSTQNLPPHNNAAPVATHTLPNEGYNRYNRYSGSIYSASPSTRYSGSPGPGAYSRDTTPTSMSSQSPGITSPIKSPSRLRQDISPIINRSLTKRVGGSSTDVEPAPVVPQVWRDSPNSSSSNSTVKADVNGKNMEKRNVMSTTIDSNPRKPIFTQSKKTHQPSPSKPPQASARFQTLEAEIPSPMAQARNQTNPLRGPPKRPSRDGAPDLKTQLGESYTIMQNNVSNSSLQQVRRFSNISRAPSPGLQQTSRTLSRNPSPSPVTSSRRVPTPTPSIANSVRPIQNTTRSTTTGAPSPSLENVKPRFGLFGRRTKTDPSISAVEKEKVPRKGPVAGTGHEGYGKYATRGRGGRSPDLGLKTPLSSRESLDTSDAFLRDRMSPVVISGGAVVENHNVNKGHSRTDSKVSLVSTRPSLESANSWEARHALQPSAIPAEPARKSSLAMPKYRRPSDDSGDGTLPSVDPRRQSIRGAPLPSAPTAEKAPVSLASYSVNSLSTSTSSVASQLETKGIMDRGRPTKSKKLEKRAKSPRKWNFFHRQLTPKPHDTTQVQVKVGMPTAKSMPHYAILDYSDETEDGSIDLEEILRDTPFAESTNAEIDARQSENQQRNLQRMEDMVLAMTPPPATMEPAESVITTTPPENAKLDLHIVTENAPVRPSRLAAVGRIPKVIPARPDTTSPASFSRPFARLSIGQPSAEHNSDRESIAVGTDALLPSHEQSTTAPMQEESRTRNQDAMPTIDGLGSLPATFLEFSPSLVSASNTTSSPDETYFAGTIAVVPQPDAAFEEDEVWNEFDDLIESKQSPCVTSSPSSSQGVPFQYESYETKSTRARNLSIRSAVPPPLSLRRSTAEKLPEAPRRSAGSCSSVYSIDMGSRLRDALKLVPTPTTPASFSDILNGYADRNSSVEQSVTRLRKASDASSVQRHSTVSGSSGRASEQSSNSPLSKVNLRIGSMTVSKWLTFGHVLFSPGREEILSIEDSSKHHSILVIDGLGNDDWSFYAAETYPCSTFYNLSPSLSTHNQPTPSSQYPPSPPNHVQIQHASLTVKFPMPSSSLDLVVLRFPPALPPSTTRHLLSEALRVLTPGGYLELAVLDLDMSGMGPRTRRAVRDLKVRLRGVTTSESEGLELGSASDMCLRLLGRRGWGDVKSCMVGIPVASIITSSSNDSSPSDPIASQPTHKRERKQKEKERKKKEERSLAEMMQDPSPAGDESITKMVAKVGRWWYSRCYETSFSASNERRGSVAKGPSGSIFEDAKVLEECEAWNASFKLCVAYAQKPMQGRRRTTSA